MKRFLFCRGVLLFIVVLLFHAGRLASADELEQWLEQLERPIPRLAEDFAAADIAAVAEAVDAVDGWAAQAARFERQNSAEAVLETVSRLVAAKTRIDHLLEDVFKQRVGFAPLEPDGRRREAIRAYLRVTSQLIDLSGRLRYVLNDALGIAAFRFAGNAGQREKLIDFLIEQKSSAGAQVMSLALFDPPADTVNKALPASPATKAKLLELIALTGQVDILPDVAQFALAEDTPPSLVVVAAETIRQVGLPQDPRPGQDPELPKPAVTAQLLHARLSKLDEAQLAEEFLPRRQELLAWLAPRMKSGLVEDTYRLGNYEVRPGDWLLMRNPSPYNLFTDLSPGLFTHVGVVTVEQGADGIRRMVLVDLPERGSEMPATNVDVFVQRTLHYVFLRPTDSEAGRKMAEVAASVIGNATEFDLNFRTELVASLRGQPLAGLKIHTYCAGLLLLCAQETSFTRTDFFPIAEYAAGGNTAKNLATLGVSFGNDFISPTGALFSSQLEIVGRREPMYDPRREVEEAIYDYFAKGLAEKTLVPSPDAYQALRLKVAQAAKGNPLLARAMARVAGVGVDTDLVSAAKAAAVVETLDEVAQSNSGDMLMARAAITAGTIESLREEGLNEEDLAQLNSYRERHAELFRRWTDRQILPRALRQALVRYYTDRGYDQLNQRFFGQAKPRSGRRRSGKS